MGRSLSSLKNQALKPLDLKDQKSMPPQHHRVFVRAAEPQDPRVREWVAVVAVEWVAVVAVEWAAVVVAEWVVAVVGEEDHNRL